MSANHLALSGLFLVVIIMRAYNKYVKCTTVYNSCSRAYTIHNDNIAAFIL